VGWVNMPHSDAQAVARRLPSDLVAIMKSREYSTETADASDQSAFVNSEFVKTAQLIVAGGLVRAVLGAEPPKDVDVFGPSVELLTKAAEELAKARRVPVIHSERCLTVPRSRGMLPVQFITGFARATPQETLAAFDFTVCQGALWFLNDVPVGLLGPRFYRDLAARRLVFIGSEVPGGSLLRAQRYIARGYRCSVHTFAKLLTSLYKSAGFEAVETDEEREREMLRVLVEVDPGSIPNE